MNIEINDINSKKFIELAYGDCLVIHGIYYMKMDGVEDVANAVNLETGTAAYFFPNDNVIPVNIVGRVQYDSNT